MLTVNDIKNVKFRKSNIGGYKHEDVDNFIDKVQEDYEKLQLENADMKEKLKVLADKVSEYRKYEDSIKDAVVKAQMIADSSLEESKLKSQELIKNAQMQSDKILLEAKKKSSEAILGLEDEIEKQKEVLFNLKKNVKDFRSKILSLYKDHLKLINNMIYDDRNAAKLDGENKNIQSNNEKSISKESNKNHNEELNNANKPTNFDRKHLNQQIENISRAIEDTKNVKNPKFQDLKFGRGYGLNNENLEQKEDESPLGLFK